MSSNPQDSQSELRSKLRADIGLFKYTFKYHDYIEAPEGTLGGKYPSQRAITELDSFIDRITPIIEAYVTTRVKEAEEILRAEVKFLEGRRQMERNRYNILAKSTQEKVKEAERLARIDEIKNMGNIVDWGFYDQRASERIAELQAQLTNNQYKE